MKKPATPKLTLRRRTIRRLTEAEIHQAAGALTDVSEYLTLCTYTGIPAGCGATPSIICW